MTRTRLATQREMDKIRMDVIDLSYGNHKYGLTLREIQRANPGFVPLVTEEWPHEFRALLNMPGAE